MPLSTEKFILPEGSPSSGEQPTKSSTWGEDLNGDLNNGTITITQGTGDPIGSLTRPIGSLFISQDTQEIYQNSDGATAWNRLVYNDFPVQFQSSGLRSVNGILNLANDSASIIRFTTGAGGLVGFIELDVASEDINIIPGGVSGNTNIYGFKVVVKNAMSIDDVPLAPTLLNRENMVWNSVTKDVERLPISGGASFTTLAEDSTSGIDGMALSAVLGSTTVEVATGRGKVVNVTLLPIDVVITTVYNVTVPASLPIPDIGTASISYVYLVADDTFQVTSVAPDSTDLRDKILLGVVGHLGGAGVVTGHKSSQIPGANVMSCLADISNAMGSIRDGVNILPNANLTWGHSGGGFTLLGSNMPSFTVPNRSPITSSALKTFRYMTSTDFDPATTTLIDPTTYDVGGVITTVPGGNNNSTIQRLFMDADGSAFVARGQNFYTNPEEAKENILADSFVLNPDAAVTGVSLIGAYILEKGNTTNLQNATFYSPNKFGELGGVASTGGSTSVGIVQVINPQGVDSDTVITNTAYFFEKYIPETTTFNNMSDYVTSVNAGGMVELGIYENGGGNALLGTTGQYAPSQGIGAQPLLNEVTVQADTSIWIGVWGNGVQMGTQTGISPPSPAVIAKEQFSGSGLPANHNSAFASVLRISAAATT